MSKPVTRATRQKGRLSRAPGAPVVSLPAEVFQPDEAFARRLDEQDPLRACRDLFHIPPSPAHSDGRPSVYLAGNSLGLMPKGARAAVEQELEDWARLAVEAHLHGAYPWYSYHEIFRDSGARLVGANPGEVVMMNSLTANLHMMMVTFYRPSRTGAGGNGGKAGRRGRGGGRLKILVEDNAFPSDSYAVASQAAFHGFDPQDAIVRLKPRQGEHTLRTEDVVAYIDEHGESIALVMLGAVNYLTGQWLDMERITAAGKARGCIVGWDLAHAAGNVPTRLHDWGVDFAVWCSYKYLNAGPGAGAGCFVHEEHGRHTRLPRFAGWWGNDPETRFRMVKQFQARPGADGWQVSNPPILSMAPLRVSIEIFDRVGMPALRAKSERLTGYLEFFVGRIPGAGHAGIQVITPQDPGARGCQLSIAVSKGAKDLHAALGREGIACDFREPNVIRAAPTPLYNTFHDVWMFANALERHFKAPSKG